MAGSRTTREHHADDRAERVHRVERADLRAEPAVLGDEGLAEDRQRAAHERGRNQEQEEHQEELEQAERVVGQPERAVRGR